MNKKAVSLITALALAASFAGCGKKAEKQEQKAATNVTVSEAKISSIESTVSYTGEVKAASSASVSPKASGEIKAVYAEIGDFVKAGTVLMKIDSSSYQLSYNQAKAAYNSAVAAYNNVKNGSNAQTQVSMNQNLSNAQSAYDTARDNYNRQKSLFDIGAISQVALDAAKTQLDNASVALETAKASANLSANVIEPQSEASAKAAVDQAKAAVDLAANSLANCTVTAPISGYISSKNASVGQTAAQGMEVFGIKNSDSVDVEINVTESVIGSLSVGTSAKIDIKSARIEGADGVVSVLGEAKNDTTGMYPVKVSINNADGKIKVGMMADVSLVTDKVDGVLTISQNSVLKSGDKEYVYVADGKKAVKKNIETGITDGKNVEVLSGISEGDKVITDGKEYLSETNNDIKIVK